MRETGEKSVLSRQGLLKNSFFGGGGSLFLSSATSSRQIPNKRVGGDLDSAQNPRQGDRTDNKESQQKTFQVSFPGARYNRCEFVFKAWSFFSQGEDFTPELCSQTFRKSPRERGSPSRNRFRVQQATRAEPRNASLARKLAALPSPQARVSSSHPSE